MTTGKRDDDATWIDATRQRAADAASLVGYTARRFWKDDCFSTAGSLSYTTMLAIVPLFAVSLAMLAAFPVFSDIKVQIQKFVFSNFVPAAGDVLQQYITKFVANTNHLTAFGIVFLAVTALMLLSTIEDTFNRIWRQVESRRIIMRLLTYWAIVTLGPLLLGGSIALSSYFFTLTEVLQIDIFQGVAGSLLQLLPFLLSVGGFMMLYMVMPNRRVRWTHALLAGVTAALLFQTLKYFFALYVRTFPSYETIYGALSTIPVFLVWMYLVWCAVLVGAELAAAIPEWRLRRRKAKQDALSPADRILVALALLRELAIASQAGETPGEETLAEACGSDLDHAAPQVEGLIAANILVRTDDDGLALVRSLDDLRLYDVAGALKLTVPPVLTASVEEHVWRKRVSDLLGDSDAAQRDVLGLSLRDLLLEPVEDGPREDDTDEPSIAHLPQKKRPG